MASRRTEQRDALREVLRESERPLSIQELLEAAQERVPALGLATVYRNVRAFVDEGWLQPVALPGSPDRYEVADRGHHHHFQCEACDRVYDVPGCARALERQVPEGFAVQRHEVVLYGTCAECAP